MGKGCPVSDGDTWRGMVKMFDKIFCADEKVVLVVLPDSGYQWWPRVVLCRCRAHATVVVLFVLVVLRGMSE